MPSSETPINTEKYGEKCQYDPEWNGPIKSRSCTDLLCLFLFIAFLSGWAVVAFFALKEGDPRILLYPTDSEGNICGIGEFENRKFLFYFDLLKCASPSVLAMGCQTPQVCVEQCPNETFHSAMLLNDEKLKYKLICKYNVSTATMDLSQLQTSEDCAKMYFKSTYLSEEFVEKMPYGTRLKDVLLNRCIPEMFLRTDVLDGSVIKDEDNREIKVEGHTIVVEEVKNATGTLATFLSFRQYGENMFSDFKKSWEYILGGLVLSMFVSLLWITLMRWIAGCMVWLSIIIVLCFSAFACYYTTTKYIELKQLKDSHADFKFTLNVKSYFALCDTWLAFACISGIVLGVLFLVILSLRSRINLAIALIKEASRAVGYMLSTLLFPIVPYSLMLGFFAIWVTVALHIASSGKASFVVSDAPAGSKVKNGSLCDPKDSDLAAGIHCLFLSYGLQENIYSAHAYNLFGLLWGLFFTVGVGQVSLAGAFAAYYWTLDKKHLPFSTLGVGFYKCIRFHLGSIAFGSLLIAIVRFIRLILEYVSQKLNKYDNKVVKFLIWCLRCCFWCLENILTFISKNAYIMVAIYGENFCNSARHAFQLLMRNIVRVVVLDRIANFLLFMGKLVVVAFAASTSFYFFDTYLPENKELPQLNYNLLPPVYITLGSYLIASSFFSVYEMAVDTMFLCFLEDLERNDGSPEKPYYMSKELMKILNKRNKFREPKRPQDRRK